MTFITPRRDSRALTSQLDLPEPQLTVLDGGRA